MPTANIYLDHQATTAVDDRVLEVMLPWLGRPANPHSREHAFGQDAAEAIEMARMQVADRVNGDPKGVVFTASATEAANIVVRSFANGRSHLLISAIEHPCVAQTAAACMKEGRAVLTASGQHQALALGFGHGIAEFRGRINPKRHCFLDVPDCGLLRLAVSDAPRQLGYLGHEDTVRAAPVEDDFVSVVHGCDSRSYFRSS